MALTSTTLSAACGASDTTLYITSTATGFPSVGTYPSPPQLMRVDGEDMLIVTVPVAGQVKVAQRGYNGTVARPHDILAVVQTSSAASDFLDTPDGAVNPRPPYVDEIITLGQNTTFAAAGTKASAGVQPYPTKDTTYLITKATACAITLIATGATTPAPSPASFGVKLTFLSGVAAAHTVTYGPGFYGDTTSSDVATFAAKVGANMTAEIGYTGLLAPVALNNVTLG